MASVLVQIVYAGELQWLVPQPPLRLLWDQGSAASKCQQGSAEPVGAEDLGENAHSGGAAELRHLLSKASKGPLLPAQQQQVPPWKEWPSEGHNLNSI